MERIDQVLAAIDAANSQDPVSVEIDGNFKPKELAHAELMTHWVTTLDPTADDAQRIAARAHHLRRWVSQRSDFPEGRAGYLHWRRDQKQRHAAEVSTMMAAAGYEEAAVDRVKQIVTKHGLATDAAVQTHEDSLCLVFLTLQFDDLIEKIGHDKSIAVIAKTWKKMSSDGHAAASRLSFSVAAQAVLDAALAED